MVKRDRLRRVKGRSAPPTGPEHARCPGAAPGKPSLSWGRQARSLLSVHTVAGQVLLLQLVLVVVLVAVTVAGLVLQSRRQSIEGTRDEVLAAGEGFANAPGTAEALDGPDPTRPRFSSHVPRQPGSGPASTTSSWPPRTASASRTGTPAGSESASSGPTGRRSRRRVLHPHRHRPAGAVGLRRRARPPRGRHRRRGGRPGDHHRQRRPGGPGATAAAPRHGRRGARAGDGRLRAGEPAAAPPDPGTRADRDDPDVRAPRRGAARGTRRRAHRRRQGTAAAGQRRGAAAAGPARGRGTARGRRPRSGSRHGGTAGLRRTDHR